MSAKAINNPSVLPDSKSLKKRKAKLENTASATPGVTASPEPGKSSEQSVNGAHDNSGESPYLKELNKNVRNAHKKLAGSAKTDAIIAENPGKSLDDLIAAKKINADQKAQVLKKPALQAQLAQLEEQLTHYRNFGREYESRFAEEKTSMTSAHAVELSKAKEEAAAEAREELAKKHDSDILVLSQFLHAAAAKRQSDEADTQEGRAYEGVLLLAYQGNSSSLDTLRNLVNGTDEKIPDTQGELLDYTFSQLKISAMENAPLSADADDAESVDPGLATSGAIPNENSHATSSDMTIAHAGLTELEDTAMVQPINGTRESELNIAPEQGSIAAEAANTAAESSWDPQASIVTTDSTTGDGWVEVPRDPTETDTGVTANPAAIHGSSNWAEEVTEGAAAEEKAAVENDGFEQVVHHPNRGRVGRGRSDFRGRGGRGDRGGRGRGDVEMRRGGRGRGRGEGGFRGGNRGRARETPAAAGDA